MSQRTELRMEIRVEGDITVARVQMPDGPITVATALNSFLDAPGNRDRFGTFLTQAMESMLHKLFPKADIASQVVNPGAPGQH